MLQFLREFPRRMMAAKFDWLLALNFFVLQWFCCRLVWECEPGKVTSRARFKTSPHAKMSALSWCLAFPVWPLILRREREPGSIQFFTIWERKVTG